MKRAYTTMIACCLCSSLALGASVARTGDGAQTVTAPAKAKAKPKVKAASKKKKKTKKRHKTAPIAKPEASKDQAAIAAATDAYKKELAQKIAQASPDRVYSERPQALLRSVVVLEFAVDRDGKLLKSAVRRSNHDPETEAAALASLRAAVPLPKPPSALLDEGRLELNETWLFNNDGRFQIRSTAQPQIDR